MKYCQKCGKQLEDDAVFCSGCGSSVSGETVRKEKPSVSAFFTVKRGLHVVVALFLVVLFNLLSDALYECNGSYYSFFSAMSEGDTLLGPGVPFLILLGVSFVLTVVLIFSNVKSKIIGTASYLTLLGCGTACAIFIVMIPNAIAYYSYWGGNRKEGTNLFRSYLILAMIIGAIILSIVAQAVSNREKSEDEIVTNDLQS